MKQVKARKHALVGNFRTGMTRWMERLPNCKVYRGHARFAGPRTIGVNGDTLVAGGIIINAGGRALVPGSKATNHSCELQRAARPPWLGADIACNDLHRRRRVSELVTGQNYGL